MKFTSLLVAMCCAVSLISLHVFMRQKHLTDAIRCSLENFSVLESYDKKDGDALRRIAINPLYAISTLYNSITPTIPFT